MKEIEAVSYVDIFYEWIHKRYKWKEGKHKGLKILYNIKLKRWYKYIRGVYKLQEIAEINNLFFKCMEDNEIPTTDSRLNHAIKYLQTWCIFDGNWLDNNDRYDCVLNGIVDLEERKIAPHSPKFKFKYKIERNLDVNVDLVIPELLVESCKAIPDLIDKGNYIKFWIAAAHKRHDYECFLLCYGVRGAGKSSNLKTFSTMWGSQVTGKKPLQEIGKRFGLSSIYDKRINIHPDMPMIPFDAFTISQIKTITGNDGDIEIEIKGIPRFNFEMKLFLAGGLNQLVEFAKNAEKEIDSIMRRAVLVEFPNVQKVNRAFKKSLADPKYLDQLYSWLVMTQPVPFYDEDNMDEWIQRNKKKWLMNADPVMRIIQDNFEFKKQHTIKAHDVIGFVREEMKKEGFLIPQGQSLKNQITNAFSAMNIYHNQKRGSKCLYQNVSEMFPDIIKSDESESKSTLEFDVDFTIDEKLKEEEEPKSKDFDLDNWFHNN